ncbi:MAG TPA: AsmA family protein [Hyphomicrobium sp.]|jgi:uncharacterized protein involved in outer membrane biogenesis
MSNGLLYIAGLVALALAALFAVPYFIDWNGYRGVFEEEATRILGREVRVGGNVNVRFLPAPFVRFDKLRIADTSTTSGEPFFRADDFTLRLSLPPLLKGIIEANEIELKRPVLRLAVDADGGGNWRSLSIAPGLLPFVPADVTLQSVKIKDGVVALHGPKGIGFAELQGLNGEFKAESIEGPFSFKGTAQWQGKDQELRFATAPTEPDGGVRFKATVRGAEQGNTYTVDGRVVDLKGRPRINGEVTANLVLDASQMPHAANGNAESPLVDFKATLVGDAMGIKLDDINVSFERVGQPQLVTGAASASWVNELDIDLQLASRWLDLDRIAASGGNGIPFATARSFVAAFMQGLPAEAETKVRFDLDQANLGGEPVSAVRIGVARTKGVLLLNELRAGLPGGTKLALDGTVGAAADARAFQGEFALRGTSLARFLNWAVKDPSMSDIVRNDGPFSLQGLLSMSDKGVDLTEAGAEIAGMPLTGEVHYASGERTRLGIVLAGQQIDGGQLWPAGVGYLKGLLAGREPEEDSKGASAAARRWLDTATSDFTLRLRAAELRTDDQPLRDVDMNVVVTDGRLSMRACKFTTSDGLAFDLEGDIADTAGEPRGGLRFVLAAPRGDAFSAFVRLWDLSEDDAKQALRYAALAPMRLAGSIRLGQRAKGAADISVDGTVEGGRVVATARLDGGLKDWNNAGADLALTLESPDVVQAFDKLSARASASVKEPRQRAGEIFFKAVGTPAKGLFAAATVKASGLFFAYDGRIELPADDVRTFDGDVRVSARELGDVMALAGLGTGGAISGAPVIGTVKMVSANHAIELRPRQLTVGGSKVDGTLALAYPESGPAIVTAQLEVDQATVPSLLGVALDHSTTAAVQAEPVTQGKAIWPESTFDFSALDGMEGKIGVGFGTLSLEPGMELKGARLEAVLSPGRIAITHFGGKVLGGSLIAALALERAPGGASMAGDLRLTDMHLQGAPADGAASKQGDGAASVTIEFSGRGSTPGGLIAVATGKGELALGDMSMRVPTPLAVVATSEAVLTGHAGGTGDALVAALRQQMGSSEVKVGPRTIAIAIADGAAKLEAFTLPSAAGATKVETTIDLSSLMVDSTWLLEPKAPDVAQPDRPRKGALPTVSIVYVGPLKDAWTLEPRIAADQLERELAIRRMELDAEQLERLHKADAERARQEEERRKAIEAEQSDRQVVPSTVPPAGDGAAVQPEGAADPTAAPQPSVEVPLPPLDDRGTAADVPLPPGQENVVVPLQSADPAFNASAAGAPAPGEAVPGDVAPQVSPEAAASAPQDANRPRRAVRRQLPAGEQVLRALQNNGTN